MDKDTLKKYLYQVKSGEMSPEELLEDLQTAPYDDLGYAAVDNHRGIRNGSSEVIYGAGKTRLQISGILDKMLERGEKNILVTRIDRDVAEFLQGDHPVLYNDAARLAVVNRQPVDKPRGKIAIVSGGTSDIPVCEEAALTAETLGNNVLRLYDVGVAGLHRLLSKMDLLVNARVVVAVAGMEGALASVVGGLVSCPVIAVPTSVGYGASFGGVAALLSMLNSCASGVSVVNIDNGFGAGYLASRINQMEGIDENLIY